MANLGYRMYPKREPEHYYIRLENILKTIEKLDLAVDTSLHNSMVALEKNIRLMWLLVTPKRSISETWKRVVAFTLSLDQGYQREWFEHVSLGLLSLIQFFHLNNTDDLEASKEKLLQGKPRKTDWQRFSAAMIITSHLLDAAAGHLCNASLLDIEIPMKTLVHGTTTTTVRYMKHLMENRPNTTAIQHQIRRLALKIRKRSFEETAHEKLKTISIFRLLQSLIDGSAEEQGANLESKMIECFEKIVKQRPRPIQSDENDEGNDDDRMKDKDDIISIAPRLEYDLPNYQVQDQLETARPSHHASLPFLSTQDNEFPSVFAFMLPAFISANAYFIHLDDVQMGTLQPQLIESNIWKYNITREVAALVSRVVHIVLKNPPQVVMGGRCRMELPSQLWCQSNSLAIYVLLQSTPAIIRVQEATYCWLPSQALALRDTTALSLTDGCSKQIEILVLRRRGATLRDLTTDLLARPS